MNLDAQIINVDGKYSNVKNHPEDEQPFAETLKKAEIKKLTEKLNKKKGKNTSKLLNYEDRLEEAYANKSYTFVQDLENDGINSAKAVSCKKKTTVKVSTTYISSKLLINAKISLASFMHDCLDRFRFPNEQTSKTDANYKIIKVLPYLLMKDTDSCLLEIILIPADSYDCCETNKGSLSLNERY